eukprot:10968503-Alexandrium_andersonii.AAC.1
MGAPPAPGDFRDSMGGLRPCGGPKELASLSNSTAAPLGLEGPRAMETAPGPARPHLSAALRHAKACTARHGLQARKKARSSSRAAEELDLAFFRA